MRPTGQPLPWSAKPFADRLSSPADFTPAVVVAAWMRSTGSDELTAVGRCERCGRSLWWHDRGVRWSAHHRHTKGSGGSIRPELGRVENCAILCGSDNSTGCHGRTHRSRTKSEAGGWMVPTGVDAATVPMLVAVGPDEQVRMWLTPDGGYLPAGGCEDVAA